MDRLHRVLAAGQGEAVIRTAAGAMGEPNDLIGRDPRAFRHVEAHREQARRRRIAVDRGAPGAEHGLRGFRVAMHVPLGRRRRIAGRPVRAGHEGDAPQQAREVRLLVQRRGQVREGPERHEGDLAGPPARLRDDQVDAVSRAQGHRRRRQLGIADPQRAMRLGRGLERAHQRHLATDGDLDLGATGELQDGPRVDRDLARLDVARQARHRDQLGFRRRRGVEQREAVVDAGVDVEDDGDPSGLHGAMLPRSRGPEGRLKRTRRSHEGSAAKVWPTRTRRARPASRQPQPPAPKGPAR